MHAGAASAKAGTAEFLVIHLVCKYFLSPPSVCAEAGKFILFGLNYITILLW